MERNYGAEIDRLSNDIAELKQFFMPQEETEPGQPERRERRIPTLTEEERVKKLFAQLEESGDVGKLTYNGVAMVGNTGTYWGRADVSLKDLMNNSADNIAGILSSLGNWQRWEILCALLLQPMTVAQLVEKFEMKTSGKAYHHLKELLAVGLLEEVRSNNVDKGTYTVKPGSIQGLAMVMAGVSDLLNIK